MWFAMRPLSVISFVIVFLLGMNVMVLVDSKEWANENILWQCEFEVDTCHFRNQHNLAQFNRYYNTRNPLFGKRALLLLNLKSPRVQRYPGARLISHYFPSRFPKACLFISYYSTGPGPQSFFVIQQDKENKCIFADHDVQGKSNRWNEIELQLDLRDGDPRFFLETHFQQGKDGYFGISKFTFGLGDCRNPAENKC